MPYFRRFEDKHLIAYGNYWHRFMFFGIALMILGAISIGASTVATLFSVIILGIIIFLSGAIILFDAFTFWWKKWSGFLVHAIIGILYLSIGLMLIRNPIEGSVSLTLLLGIFYIAAGVFRIAFSSLLQTPRWGWSWFNGLITLIIGILIITSWPGSSLFIIGLFVGIDLVFTGLAYVMSALAARNLVA